MVLRLEVEFLAGFCAAATGPGNEQAEWPPSGDRLFSALVASWAARGCDPREAEALRWLEHQPAPLVRAADAFFRTTPKVYVPPNDPRVERAKKAKQVLPQLRDRQPRRFAVARPVEPVVTFDWPEEPGAEMFDALAGLAADLAYLGASRSLVRCRFTRAEPALDRGDAAAASPRPTQRWVYRGRLQELEEAYAHFERDPSATRRRPGPGVPVAARPDRRPASAAGTVFSGRWLVLEHVAGTMPDLRAAAIVARQIRNVLMSGFGRLGLPVPEWVSGHGRDGGPTPEPHLAIVPLPFVGFPHADGHVLGFALVPPRGRDLLQDDAFKRVMRKLAPVVDGERREVTVCSPAGTSPERAFGVVLSPRFGGGGRHSLDPQLYLRPARRFATVTPILLDRHLKARGAARLAEIRESVAAACQRIGLPEPVEVVPDRHATFEGAPSVRVNGTPPWSRWRVPETLASRQLTHAVIEFAEPVAGPAVLGAGRFCGLGLCRPLP